MTVKSLWELARRSLGLLPDQVADVAGDRQVRAMLESSWVAVEQLEELWRHSRGADQNVPPAVTRELVLFSVRQACFFAEFVLAVLDRRRAATVAAVPAGQPAKQLEPRWYAEDELIRRQQQIVEEERRRSLMLQQQRMRA